MVIIGMLVFMSTSFLFFCCFLCISFKCSSCLAFLCLKHYRIPSCFLIVFLSVLSCKVFSLVALGFTIYICDLPQFSDRSLIISTEMWKPHSYLGPFPTFKLNSLDYQIVLWFFVLIMQCDFPTQEPILCPVCMLFLLHFLSDALEVSLYHFFSVLSTYSEYSLSIALIVTNSPCFPLPENV